MLLLAANSIKQDKAKPSGIVPILAIFYHFSVAIHSGAGVLNYFVAFGLIAAATR